MSRTNLIVVVAFVLALCAGVVMGLVGARIPEARHERSWIADELNLSTPQRERMRAIWSEMPRSRGRDERRAIEKERDDALLALMNDQQRQQAQEVIAKYSERVSELSRQREQAYEQAVARTQAILTDAQREKYDELLKRRAERDPRPRQGSGEEPATQPAR
ncbi:MAG: Spy/CpxP family protein refolding chaperone [Tepidisphaeraceae bacterium]